MALLSWSNKYSVGVKEVDDQHATFIGILNELHAAMMRGQAQSIAGPLLNKLQSYAREHFSTEERLMETAKYPGLAKHRQQHVELTSKIAEYAACWEKNDNTVFLPLLHFLRDWISGHLLEEDKAFTSWEKERGIR